MLLSRSQVQRSPLAQVSIEAVTEENAVSSESSSILQPAPVSIPTFSDDEVLPVFEANLDLPTAAARLRERVETCNR